MSHQEQLERRFLNGNKKIALCQCGDYYTAISTREYGYSRGIRLRTRCIQCSKREKCEQSEQIDKILQRTEESESGRVRTHYRED